MLQDMRIVVKDISEDLYDGHILILFVGKLVIFEGPEI